MKVERFSMLIFLVAFIWGLPLPSHAADKANDRPDNFAKGKTVFDRHCAGCHGPQGKGDGYKLLGPEPADLTAPATMRKSDADLLATIHEGKPNMPSWKGLLPEDDLRQVLAYVRTLRR